MKIRGDLSVLRDIIIKTAANNATVGKILYAQDTDGKAFWQNFKLYETDVTELYPLGAVIVSADMNIVYIAIVDDALGSETSDELQWKKLIDNNDSGVDPSDHTYLLNEHIKSFTAPQDVGGVLSVYDFASNFRGSDGVGNQSVSAVLDSILFPLVKPKIIRNASSSISVMGKRLEESVYIDIADKIISVGEIMDVRLYGALDKGAWSTGQEYVGEVVSNNGYTFYKDSTTEVKTDSTTTDTITSSHTTSKTYKVMIEYLAGTKPTDSLGNSGDYTAGAAGFKTSPTVKVNFGYPILTAMLTQRKETPGELSTYLNSSILDTLYSNGGIFISPTTSETDVTNKYLGLLKYPYVLIPASYGTSLLSFYDAETSKEYSNNFTEFAPVEIELIPGEEKIAYKVYVFETITSITFIDNKIELTVG